MMNAEVFDYLRGICKTLSAESAYLAQVHVQVLANEAALVNTVGFQILSFPAQFCRK